MSKIVIVDRTAPSWIDKAIHLLPLEGVECVLETKYTEAYAAFQQHNADLMIVNSASMGKAEKQLIFSLLSFRCPIAVTSVDIPAPLMREFFRAGAVDVAEHVNTANAFGGVVFSAFRRLIPRAEVSYQEQERLLNANRG